MSSNLNRVVIVNRGEPALRFIRGVNEFNRVHGTSIRTIALFTRADERAVFVREADEAIDLGLDFDAGADTARRSPYENYAVLERVLGAAQADAVWPGWGFVSEEPAFVELCDRLGVAFIGPSARAMRLVADKVSAKRLAAEVGVPVTPWAGATAATIDVAREQADRLGYPVVVKPASGGGGRGIHKVGGPEGLAAAFERAREESRKLFADPTLFVERWVEGARHVEVQIVGDQHGTVWALGVRDCSIQRRHQKLLEEAPSPVLSDALVSALQAAAVRLAQAAGYHSTGTVEFLCRPATGEFTLMEVNARLQVEHAVTELTTGVDLVGLQLVVARGGRLDGAPPEPCGHAIEVRLNAEDVEHGFAPAPGRLQVLRVPTRAGLRLDAGVREGDAILPEYDSMFAKLIAYGATRDQARDVLLQALETSTVVIDGGITNRTFLERLLALDAFRDGSADVEWLDRLAGDGAHVSRAYADVAILAAATDVYESTFVEERDEFLASAARIRPIVDQGIGCEIELQCRGERYRLRVYRLGAERYRADVDGVRVDVHVEALGPHERRLTYAGRRHRVITVAQGLAHLVEVGGALHRVSRDEAGLVRAFAPAVVVQVLVEPGERVDVGQRVAVLEAMKMETPIVAPCAGTVRSVSVMQNAHVAGGAPIVKIDPDLDLPAVDRVERVRFEGQPLAPAHGGRPASRSKALVGGIRAFAEALGPADLVQAQATLDQLRELVLGSDIDAAEARRLVDDYRRVCERLPADHETLLRHEDDILGVFADVSSLFRRVPGIDDPNDPTALSAGQYFLTYLRTLEARGADLPPTFVEQLRRTLRHFGSDSLEVTPALKSRLLRIYKTHQRVGPQVGAVTAILERRLRQASELAGRADDSLWSLLDRLIAASEGMLPIVADLARDVRYRYFVQPVYERERRAIYADMEAHLAHLMRDPEAPDRDERVSALVDCPVPLGGLLSGRFEDAAPIVREVMLEVMTRRYYRIRQLEHITSRAVGRRSLAAAEYEFAGRRVHVLASHSAWEELAAAGNELAPEIAAIPAGCDVVVDFYVSPPKADMTADELSTAIAGTLNRTAFGRPLRRVVVAVGGASGMWAASATRYFTYRWKEGGYQEDRTYRGLHPMTGKRLEVWRLSHFDIKRLPSAEDVYLFHGCARSNPKDERLFALAEVRDATAIRNEQNQTVFVPGVERTLLEALAAVREEQLRRPLEDRLHWNRVLVHVAPPFDISRDEVASALRRSAGAAEGLGLEKVVLRARMPDAAGTLRDTVISMANPGGRGIVLRYADPSDRPLLPLDEYTQKVVRMRQRGLTYPYEVVRMLTPAGDAIQSDLPPGEFVEHDLDAEGRLVPADRPHGRNTANIVVGVIRNFTAKHPEGMSRVILVGDPSREMGSLAEPECARILAALDLAASMRVPLEWFALSAGAKISMESGTENMDWIGRVLRRIVEVTQDGHEINVIVTGINVGAQPYWNAEATMLMHTRGILVMMPESAMVLTGKTALDYSGSVSAEDNLGIGGYERIMGPNGQAQYWARDLDEACHILLRHYDHTYLVPGEPFPRRAGTTDPPTRDVRTAPHAPVEGAEFTTVGDIFSNTSNPGRKKPFDIRSVMAAVADQDHQPLERWAGMRDAEVGVVWDAHVGGFPVCLLGFESRTLPRLGFVPTDGPDHWTSGTLFPMSSKKMARAINAASGNRPLVILANLSGFDGSPESMRRRQLEFGAEIGRAVVNFRGPIIFTVISRYHGGAFVVFSRTLHDNMQVSALEDTYASVIGGAPAAAVVFAREVDTRTRKDPRVQTLEQEFANADDENKRRLRPRLAALVTSVRSEKLGEVADEFDHIHSVHRALNVGSLDRIIPASQLRAFLIEAIEAGMRRDLTSRQARQATS